MLKGLRGILKNKTGISPKDWPKTTCQVPKFYRIILPPTMSHDCKTKKIGQNVILLTTVEIRQDNWIDSLFRSCKFLIFLIISIFKDT